MNVEIAWDWDRRIYRVRDVDYGRDLGSVLCATLYDGFVGRGIAHGRLLMGTPTLGPPDASPFAETAWRAFLIDHARGEIACLDAPTVPSPLISLGARRVVHPEHPDDETPGECVSEWVPIIRLKPLRGGTEVVL